MGPKAKGSRWKSSLRDEHVEIEEVVRRFGLLYLPSPIGTISGSHRTIASSRCKSHCSRMSGSDREASRVVTCGAAFGFGRDNANVGTERFGIGERTA